MRLPDCYPDGRVQRKCPGKALSEDTQGESSAYVRAQTLLEEQALLFLETEMLPLRMGSGSEIQVSDREERQEWHTPPLADPTWPRWGLGSRHPGPQSWLCCLLAV